MSEHKRNLTETGEVFSCFPAGRTAALSVNAGGRILWGLRMPRRRSNGTRLQTGENGGIYGENEAVSIVIPPC